MTRRTFAKARAILRDEGREALIEFGPKIGLTRAIARKAFASPRDISLVYAILNEHERINYRQNLDRKKTVPLMMIARDVDNFRCPVWFSVNKE